MYRHLANDRELDLNAGKVVCVGRNYAAHARELGNDIPQRPVIFIKPMTAMINWRSEVKIPGNQGACHHELELALLIDKPLQNATPSEALSAISAVTLALDLTLRDVQAELKAAGQPWELAKAFDQSCPIAKWFPLPSEQWLQNAQFSLSVNSQQRQQGNASHMIWPAVELISYITRYFSLMPGDVVLTGTPSGVAELKCGDHISAQLDGVFSIESEVKVNERHIV